MNQHTQFGALIDDIFVMKEPKQKMENRTVNNVVSYHV